MVAAQRILVVDNDPIVTKSCRRILAEDGYEVDTTESGREGLDRSLALNFDLVIVDLRMPDLDGMELVRALRHERPQIAVIIITGYGTIESAVEAMRMGIRDYLSKPFDEEALLQSVRRGLTGGGAEMRPGTALAGTAPRVSFAPPSSGGAAVTEVEPAVEVATQAMSASQLLNFVETMIAEQNVIGVKAKEGAPHRFVFGPLETASELRLDYDVTVLPPKKYLLPPRETLFKFKLGDAIEAEPCVEVPQPTALIGVHPYDMIAINQLDRLMSQDNPDPNYLARRGALSVIGVDPARVSENAFWGAMGCAFAAKGFDLWLTDIGDAYVVEVGTRKGVALLERYARTSDATSEDLEARATVRDRMQEMANAREVDFRPSELPDLLRRSFRHKIWQENAQKCLSCGSCNLVCPTCYCFDVKDDIGMNMKEGERYRVWDGCVLEDFAKVATGENFREMRRERYRHRFYRKGMYLYDKYGLIACVGCGRCAAACLSDIADPVAVYGALKKEEGA